ncbi:UDP binding domain-containing protein [Streptomyces sp. NPDC127036]|uniref:UDP binding domain-containing protein n=1 Tax=Streptomyces sp. NPDC127036 TaxID=3347112 RepID=UPI00365D78AB
MSEVRLRGDRPPSTPQRRNRRTSPARWPTRLHRGPSLTSSAFTPISTTTRAASHPERSQRAAASGTAEPWSSTTRHATPDEALEGADAAVVVTEWTQLKDIDWAQAAQQMRRPVLFDGRRQPS